MILSVGEILLDMIGEESEDGIVFDSHAGGAPLNVAAQIAKLGGDAYFIGSIGEDIPGKYLKKYIKTLSLKDYRLAELKGRNTTLAFVKLENGERDFAFYRENTSDYLLPTLEDEFLKGINIVHVGSLMLSKEEGYDYAVYLASKAKKNGCYVSFDVNFRKDIYASVDEAIEKSKTIMEMADFIKMSDDEIEIFGEEYCKGLSLKHHLFVTKGKKGSAYYYKDDVVEVGAFIVDPIDTTGAGDAFYGALLSKLDKNTNPTLAEIKEMLILGNACGALATLGKGAISPLATLDEAKAFIANGGKR